MADGNFKFVFSNAIIAAVVRAEKLSFGHHKRDICRSFAAGFEIGEYQGDVVYTNSVEPTDLGSIEGFSASSYYHGFESVVRSIVDSTSYLSGLGESQKKIFTIIAHAIIFGHALNPNDTEENLYTVFGKTLVDAGNRFVGVQPFPIDKFGFITHPFTGPVIRSVLSQNNYSLTIQEISSSPKLYEVDLVHYNWYDSTRLFSGPNLNVMKDAENQYYYISGKLIYEDIPQNLNYCEEENFQISTPTGAITVTNYKNFPCVERTSYIGPKTDVKFYRIFNDGPYSSGDFSTEVLHANMAFDKEKLATGQYNSNASSFYSFNKVGGTGSYIPVHANRVFYDTNGEYNIPLEYEKAPIGTGCSGVYQVMRVGDARMRMQCLKYDELGVCIQCEEQMVTGFKYAVLELEEERWGDEYAEIRTNPPITTERLLRRTLNLNPNPYRGTIKDGFIQTFTDNAGSEEWYVGPPQVTGGDVLPYFAFTNNFYNGVFGQNATVTLYPAIGTALGSSTGDSTRKFEISLIPLVTGKDGNTNYSVIDSFESKVYPKAKFYTTIPSYISGDDDTKLKVFGMGDAFTGKYVITGFAEENAGYLYTGFLLKDVSGNYVSTLAAAASYASFIIGSAISGVKYISGYTGANSVEISKMFAHNNNGKYLEYYFFDNRTSPVSVSNQTGWTTFAPLPTELEGKPNYERAYGIQKNENYAPRYSRGPYATFNRNFLYPNAEQIHTHYESKVNGFPMRFKYKVVVREEAVKELYAKFAIQEGVVSSDPNYINVIRPPESNFGVQLGTMPNIFSCSTFECDFNQWELSLQFFYNSGINAVDNNWAPQSQFWFDGFTSHVLTPSGKNTVTYNSNATFKQGILLTGTDVILHRQYSGVEQYSGRNFYSPKPEGVGVYHGFTGYTISGVATYTKPIFSLENGALEQLYSLQALPIMRSGCIAYRVCNPFCSPSIATGLNRLYTKELNGRTFYSISGFDPIFSKYIGGRRGGPNAEAEGGYHPKGIIGDSWIGMNYDSFGYYCSLDSDVCDDTAMTGEKNYGINARVNDNRVPSEDSKWLLFNITPDATRIYTRALVYNPLGIDYTHRPFVLSDTVKVNGSPTTVDYKQDIQALYFDLSSYFPLRARTGNAWYFNPSGSGLVLGPFDRDVELFADRYHPISGYTQIYLNGRLLTDLFDGVTPSLGSLECQPFKYLSGDTYTFWHGGDPFDPTGGYTTYQNIKLLGLIPSGETATINVRSIVDTSNPAHTGNPALFEGFPFKSYLHIRARKPLNEAVYETNDRQLLGILGEDFWLNNLNMANNGSERVYEISHPNGRIDDLAGKTYNFTTYSRSGKLYPIPDSDTFKTYRTEDAFGNESFSVNVEEFWRQQTAKDLSTVFATGWREGSRISFQFVEVTPEYDTIPFEGHTTIVPSGDCIVSGEMGYVSQADNAVFTEGFYLQDVTPNDKVRDELYGPFYISDVLQRVPQFIYPSGGLANPVLSAPSVMKQRKDRFNIVPDQEYSGLNSFPPYNYNKLLWPALSDLRTLNPEETLESVPPDDGNTYTNSTMLLSASQGQKLPNGKNNPAIKKVYMSAAQFQLYDSLATDALINFKYFITSGFGFETSLKQPESGVLVPKGTTLTDIKMGLVKT